MSIRVSLQSHNEPAAVKMSNLNKNRLAVLISGKGKSVSTKTKKAPRENMSFVLQVQ
jgi:hypothetical protein